MATLTDDELGRIKYEVLDNVLDIGAIPYISIRAACCTRTAQRHWQRAIQIVVDRLNESRAMAS